MQSFAASVPGFGFGVVISRTLSTGSHGVIGLLQVPTYGSASAERLQKVLQAVGVEMAHEQPHLGYVVIFRTIPYAEVQGT